MKALAVGDDIYPFEIVEDVYAVRANLQARLSIVQGEYMPDVGLGIPLGATQEEIDLNVQRIILDTTGVTGIVSFRSTVANKKYACQFEASTVFGSLVYG